MTDRIDVSQLKAVGFGYDSPLWWGQVLMAVIEGFMILLLAASYLFGRLQFVSWPPAGANTQGLLLPSLNLLILVGSLVPMHIGDKAVLKCEWKKVYAGIGLATVFGIVALGLQLFLWSRFEFPWYANLYASLVWVLLGVHTMHMVASLTETAILLAMPMLGYKSDPVRKGLNVDEVYWYLVVVSALVVYGIVFFAPRFL